MKRGCPGKRKLVRAFTGGLSRRATFKLLDHVYGCPACRAEFDALSQLWRQSREALAPLTGVELSADARGRLGRPAGREGREIRFAGRRSPSLKKMAFPAVSTAFGLIIIAMAVFFLRGPRQDVGERASLPWEIELFEPELGGGAKDLVFRWEHLQGAESYSLEVFDKGLDPVYERSGITGESYILPPDVTPGLKKGEVYFWRIKAFLADDRVIESDFSKLVLKDD
jgi:hypothetical protein